MGLEGKIIDFLGDSITEGTGVEQPENRFDRILQRECGLKEACNYGIGGTRIAHQSVASIVPRYDLCFCGRVYDLNPKADIIIVFGGTNDYGHGNAPFGSMEDTLPDTFCGAVEFLMSFLAEQYAGTRIIFLAPVRREGDCLPSEDMRKFLSCTEAEKDDYAKPLKAYVDVIVEKGRQHEIEVYNLYEELPINPNLEEDKKRYTSDGLHLNDAGHRVLAEYLKQKLGVCENKTDKVG